MAHDGSTPDAGRMDTPDDSGGRLAAFGRPMGRADGALFRSDRTTAAVVAFVALALAARLVGLGARPFHWDEARVGYWALRFLRTGAFEYRPVAGGPFLYVVDRYAVALFGPSDASARLVVALLGGLFPSVALLFRGRLRDDETVILAAILAASPLLVYYSRFLRGDVPVAVFGLAAVGFVVRAHDTGSWRTLYAAAAATALAWAASGFAVAYLACWVVAGVLVFDHRTLLDRRPSPAELRAAGAHLRAWRVPLARAFLVWFAVVFYFFAPRAGGGSGPGLWKPTTLPAVVERAVFTPVWRFYGVRVVNRAWEYTHPLLPYVSDLVSLLRLAALPLLLLAAYAFLCDRYGPDGPRPVVAFHAYWGFVAVPVFAAATEVLAPWVGVHVVTPLAVPAAVGGATLVRRARAAVRRDDAAAVAATALVVLALVAQVGTVAASDVYGPNDADNRLAQYAQPADDLTPLARNVSRTAAVGDGVDVLYYGERFYLSDEGLADSPPVPDEWGNRLPLPWYVERAGAETASVRNLSTYDGDLPPVILADASQRGTLSDRLSGYDAATYRLSLSDREVVVFVQR